MKNEVHSNCDSWYLQVVGNLKSVLCEMLFFSDPITNNHTCTNCRSIELKSTELASGNPCNVIFKSYTRGHLDDGTLNLKEYTVLPAAITKIHVTKGEDYELWD